MERPIEPGRRAKPCGGGQQGRWQEAFAGELCLALKRCTVDSE
jgi:hypothetical protein